MALVLRYKFNDPASLTTDSSGNSHNLVNAGGVVSVADPTHGNVVNFNASSTSHLALASPPSSITGGSARTYSFWVKRKVTSGNYGSF